jgi:hypothetical protein
MAGLGLPLLALAFSLTGADRGGGGIARFHDDLTW